MQTLDLKVPPAAVGLMCAAIMWAISTICSTTAFPLPGAQIVAVAIAIVGGGTIVAGILAFRRDSTTVNPLKPDKTESIVVHGIYRFTRNPMYLGVALILVGWAMYLANIAALLVVPAFVAYMTQFQIKPEERALLKKFGRTYTEYTASVGRWI